MTAQPQVASFADQVSAAVAEARDQRLRSVDPRTILTLAVVPEWTGALAAAVLKLGDDKLQKLIDGLEADGLARVERLATPSTDPLIAPRVVGLLGDLVSEESVASALDAVASITSDPADRLRALIELAPALPASRVRMALDVASSLPPADRARLIAAVISRVPTPDRPPLAEEVASATVGAAALDRAELLVAVAPSLPTERRMELVGSTIEAARVANSDSLRASILIRILPAVPMELAGALAAATDGIVDARARASVVLAMAIALPELAVRMTDRDAPADDARARVTELSAAAIARVRQGDVEGATRKADQIDDPLTRGQLLSRLLGYLGEDASPRDAVNLAEHAAAVVADVSDPFSRSTVRAEAAACFAHNGDVASARRLVEQLQTPDIGLSQTVQGIGPLIGLARAARAVGDTAGGDTAAASALAIVLAADDTRARVTGLAGLLPDLGAADASRATSAALSAIDTLGDPLDRAQLLAALSRAVDPTTLGPAVARTLKLLYAVGPRVAFWLLEDVRRAAIERATRQSPPVDLPRLIAGVGADVGQAIAAGAPGNDRLARWVELARRLGPTTDGIDAARWLTLEVDRTVTAGDLAAAHSLVASGTAVAQIVGEPLTSAVRQADRTIALVHRRANDVSHLRTFLRRSDQVDAITALLDGPDDCWALHFLGVAGVGKTTLIRYLSGEIARERKLATARVDFDYLSPDYPGRRPGELLLALAGELEAYAESARTEEIVHQLQDDAVALHAGLAKKERVADQLEAIDSPAFDNLVGLFYELLLNVGKPAAGGSDRRIVLILDTCEELAKLQPEGTKLPSLVATFRIIEAIHERFPSLRVIFAGRRLLARSGADWRVAKRSLIGTSALLPDSKRYLGLHEIRGFDEAQAREYLRRLRGISLDAPTEKRLYAASVDVAPTVELVWIPRRPKDTEQRVSPFDLAVNAEFADDLAASEDIDGRLRDVYVERRIIGRIQPRDGVADGHRRLAEDVRALLPAAVLLGRFDGAMLGATHAWSVDRFDAAFRELASQEWIDVQRGEAPDARFLTIDRNLLPRLRAYFDAASRRAATDRVAESLGPALAEVVDSTSDVAAIPVELVDAALRLLPPAAASACWDAFMHRCLAVGRLDRCEAVARQALDVEGWLGMVPTHPLAAAVRAGLVGALVQGTSEEDPAPHWAAIAGALAREPDPDIRAWLAAREVAFRISTGDRAALEGAAGTLDDVFAEIRGGDSPNAGMRADQLAASYVAAFEALVERWEAAGTPFDNEALVTCTTSVANAAPLELQVFIGSLTARIASGLGQYDLAERAMQADELEAEAVEPTATSWLDWRAPDVMLDRIRLEALRLPTRVIGHVKRRKGRADRPEVPGPFGSIDTERLASAVLADRLSRGVVPHSLLESLESQDVYDPDRVAHCNAHRETPQLAITLAEGYLAAGDPDRAMTLLQRRRDEAFASGKDTATKEAMELAILAVARRMRLSGGDITSLVDRFAASSDAQQAGLALEVAVLTRGSLGAGADRLADEAPERWWRVQATIRPELRDRVPTADPVPAQPVDLGGATFVEVMRALDAFEQARVRGSTAFMAPLLPTRWGRNHPVARIEGARIAARALMLGAFTLGDPSLDREQAGLTELAAWEPIVGRRRLALITLDEAELLALRLPHEAVKGFRAAARMFRDSDDSVGQFFASTGLALALVHAGDVGRRRTTARHLEATYRELHRKRGAERLPTWEAIRDAAGRSIRAPIERLADDRWGPWIQRLYVATAWAFGGSRTRLPMPTSEQPTALPAELLDLGAQKRGSEVLRTIVEIGASLLRLVTGIVGTYIALYIVLPGYDWQVWYGVAVLTFVVLFVLVTVRGVLTGDLLRLVTRLSLDVSASAPPATSPFLRLRATAPVSASGLEEELSASNAILLGASAALIRLGANLRYRQLGAPNEGQARPMTGDGPDALPYAERVTTIPDDIARELLQRTADAGKSQIILPIRADRGTSSEPWEALLTLAAGSEPDPKTGRRHLVAYREADPLPGPRRGGRRTFVRVVADADLRSAWRSWLIRSGVTVSQVEGPEATVAGDGDILHLIGRPVEGDGEVVLQVGSGDTRSKASSLETAVRGSTNVALARLDLRTFALVVIQTTPDDPDRREASDRRKAARTRALALDALAGGAETVVLVPSLPSPLADAVIRLLARRLGPQTRRARASEYVRRLYASNRGAPTYRTTELTSWLADARALIDGWAAERKAPSGIFDELALDLTLYTRPATPREETAADTPAPDSSSLAE